MGFPVMDACLLVPGWLSRPALWAWLPQLCHRHRGAGAAGDPALCRAVCVVSACWSTSSAVASGCSLQPWVASAPWELEGTEGWGQPRALAITCGFGNHLGPWQRSQGRPKRIGFRREEEQ